MVGPHPADLVFAPTPACGGGRRPRRDGLAPSPGPVARPGAGLTSKPRHARRPTVALRGSFRPRLASTTGEDPRATTDPVESPFEYSHAPVRRTRAPPSAPRRRGRPRARAHRRMPQPSRPSSARRRPAMTRRGTRAVRRTGSNAPRMAARRSTPGRRACGAVATDRCTSRGDRQARSAAHRHARAPAPGRTHARPAAGRASGTHVTASRRRRTDRDHGVGERRRDAPPPRELQPVDRRARRPVVQERRASEPARAEAGSPGTDRP